MEAKMSKFFDSVGTFFTGADNIPWCDRDIIADEDDDCMRLHSNHGYKGIKGEGSASSREGYRSRRRGRVAEGEKGCEGEISEAATEEQKNDSIMRLSWALVHSRQTDDVNRGIGMIEATLDKSTSPLQTREKLYLMAVGHYRNGNYVRSRQLADRCLEIQPDWRQASSLKKAIEDKIAKDGVIGIGIATTAVGLIVGGIAAALARRN